LFNLYFIPRMGFMASAWATLAAYSVMTMISYILGRRYYGVPYPVGRILFYILTATLLSFWMYMRWHDRMDVKLAILAGFAILVGGMEWRKWRGLVGK